MGGRRKRKKDSSQSVKKGKVDYHICYKGDTRPRRNVEKGAHKKNVRKIGRLKGTLPPLRKTEGLKKVEDQSSINRPTKSKGRKERRLTSVKNLEGVKKKLDRQ